jgi:putative membrane protein
MSEFLIYLIINSIAVAVTAALLPGVRLEGIGAKVITVVVLGVITAFIKPVLVLLTLPISVVTLGLFVFVINALLVLLVSNLVPGFEVDGFWWALVFSLVLSVVNMFLVSLTR